AGGRQEGPALPPVIAEAGARKRRIAGEVGGQGDAVDERTLLEAQQRLRAGKQVPEAQVCAGGDKRDPEPVVEAAGLALVLVRFVEVDLPLEGALTVGGRDGLRAVIQFCEELKRPAVGGV